MMLKDIVDKVEERVFPHRSKSRAKKVSLRRKRRTMSKKKRFDRRRYLQKYASLHQQNQFSCSLSHLQASDLDRDVSFSQLMTDGLIQNAVQCTESLQANVVPSCTCDRSLDCSCSFSSINPIDVEKNDENEKSVGTNGGFSMISNAAGDRVIKTDKPVAACLNDNNQLGLVRLELETIVQNNGLQGDGCTESPSDGCWSPSQLRSAASTAREKCDTTLYPICCEIDAKLVKTASDPATKVQQLVNVVEGFTAEMDAALPHLIENAQAEVRQIRPILLKIYFLGLLCTIKILFSCQVNSKVVN